MRQNTSQSRLAIVLLLLGVVWLALTASGVFRFSPIRLPAWTGLLAAVGVLAGPAIFAMVPKLQWRMGLPTAIIFLVCTFVFPWYYERSPGLYWLTILLAYVEVFGLVPLFLKKRTSEGSKPETEDDQKHRR